MLVINIDCFVQKDVYLRNQRRSEHKYIINIHQYARLQFMMEK